MISLIIITWFSFFISRAAPPARVALPIIGFLSISNVINSVLSSLPRLDGKVWLLDLAYWSSIFVMMAAIEYALVAMLFRAQVRIERVLKNYPPPEKKEDIEDGTEALPRSDVDASPTVLSGSKEEGVTSSSVSLQKRLNKPKSPNQAGLEKTHERSIAEGRDEAIRSQLGPFDRMLLNKRNKMRIQDQHLDIFCRYAYPISFMIVLGCFFARVADVAEAKPYHACP